MINQGDLQAMRQDYGDREIDVETLPEDPFELFQHWFDAHLLQCRGEPNAMTLSTVDASGLPDARTVLLKGASAQGFVFYTNYQSQKAAQIAQNPQAAALFYWPESFRQVKVRGSVLKVDAELSDAYFVRRPKMNQIAASVSPQSQPIESFQVLDAAFEAAVTHYSSQSTLARPQHWGGYRLVPSEFEYWQGRDSRLHRRVRYQRLQEKWKFLLLAP